MQRVVSEGNASYTQQRHYARRLNSLIANAIACESARDITSQARLYCSVLQLLSSCSTKAALKGHTVHAVRIGLGADEPKQQKGTE